MPMRLIFSVNNRRAWLSILLALSAMGIKAQSLPDALTLFSGDKVKTGKQWYTHRQPEIKDFFIKEVYGKQPDLKDFTFRYSTIEEETAVLEGKAFRKQVRMFISNEQHDAITVDFLLYYPVKAKQAAVPVFTLLNYGNHTLSQDTGIHLSASKLYSINQKRGAYSRRFPIESIIQNGCAVITSCYEDFIPDRDSLFRKATSNFYRLPYDSTGAIAIWAWGYSRMVDYALKQRLFDPGKIAVVGHSRTGKAALWAAVNDSRIQYAFVNESGNSGAKLNFHLDSRAETIERINTQFPHWFPLSYEKYNGKDMQRSLPYDQHWLIASIAPRHVYIGNAKEDYWGDPAGEFQSLKEGEKVFQFLGLKTSLPSQMPATGVATTTGFCGYHIREGNHDLLPEDWLQFIQFIKQ
jgi:hypothetical protein